MGKIQSIKSNKNKSIEQPTTDTKAGIISNPPVISIKPEVQTELNNLLIAAAQYEQEMINARNKFQEKVLYTAGQVGANPSQYTLYREQDGSFSYRLKA